MLGSGRATSVGVTVPVPHVVMVPTEICDWPWFSPAVPVTRTRSPRPTVFPLLPSKTKIPSEVAGSPSPLGSWMKNPRSAGLGPS